MSLPIVRYNDPVLRKKGARVTAFDAALVELSRQMVDTMHAAHGIGLAAQQIGRAIQLCVVDLRDADAKFKWTLDGARPPLELFMPMTLVNPEIAIARGTEKDLYEEGCLSFPQIRGDVERPVAITVKFRDEHGVPHEMVCDGLLARCVQHEVDHLNGVLFIDHMTKKVRDGIEEAIKALAKETRESAKKPAST